MLVGGTKVEERKITVVETDIDCLPSIWTLTFVFFDTIFVPFKIIYFRDRYLLMTPKLL